MRTTRILFLCSPFLLIACTSGQVKNTFGLNRTAPDEFTVVSRPPLSVPPEFELTPPKPGATGPAQPAASDQAHQELTGKESPQASLEDLAAQPASDTAVPAVVTSDAPSTAESNFMSKLGADKADPDIRDKLSADSAIAHPVKKGNTLYEKMMGDKTPNEPTVDPTKETQRIQDNKAQGQSPAQGDENVPTIQDKPKSVIDEIF